MKLPWFKKETKTLPYDASLRKDAEEAELNIYSKTWRFIEEWQKEKLNAERLKNDARRFDAIDTAYMRGRISILKEILELPNERAGNTPTNYHLNAGNGE